jgi:hypothetical protein
MNMKCLGVLGVMLMAILSAQGAYVDVIGPEVYWVLGAWTLILIGLFIGGIVLIASIVTWGSRKSSLTGSM